MSDQTLTVGSLFSGIGGFDLGFERAGFDIRWQVEIDPFCQRVLAKNWPNVRRYGDVRHVMGHAESCGRRARGTWRSPHSGSGVSDCSCWDRRAVFIEPVDVLCGGFPCQPHSLAGRRAAAADDRDLWPEFRRLIRELEPRWVVAENVPGLLSSDAGRFFGNILRDLAACGYDAEWDCLPASAVGAPHRRDRVWLVAYPVRGGREERPVSAGQNGAAVSDAARRGTTGTHVADAQQSRLEGFIGDGAGSLRQTREIPQSDRSTRAVDICDGARIFTTIVGQWREWEPESGFCRMAHGVPHRVHRLRALGNSIVPQIAEWIARRILAASMMEA